MQQIAKLDDNKMVEILDYCYQKALNGIPMVSESVSELGEYYLKTYPTKEMAIDKLISNQIKKCTASGFVTGLGGAMTLPITLPSNITSVLYIQLRMIASIAYIMGYDVRSDEVKTMVYLCLIGSAGKDILKGIGITTGKVWAKSAIKKIPNTILRQINKAIGGRIITKYGKTGAINLTKCIPLVGGVVGGGLDFASTKIIAKYAKEHFYINQKDDLYY